MPNGEILASLGLERAVVLLVGESSEVGGALDSSCQVDLKELEALSGALRWRSPTCDESISPSDR